LNLARRSCIANHLDGIRSLFFADGNNGRYENKRQRVTIFDSLEVL
jgi:hypothetical protein